MQLFNDDALSVLKTLPDNSIDLIATDPPYFLFALAVVKVIWLLISLWGQVQH